MRHDTPPIPLVIGWKECLALPEWGLKRVRAKVDTGARTSALDVISYDLRHEEGKGLRANLRLATGRRRLARPATVDVAVVDMVAVRCSSGICEHRPVIETDIVLGSVRKRIRLTVTHRASMRFRMLLGRQALQSDFIVDVSRTYVLRR